MSIIVMRLSLIRKHRDATTHLPEWLSKKADSTRRPGSSGLLRTAHGTVGGWVVLESCMAVT